jgi:hypothetical protein
MMQQRLVVALFVLVAASCQTLHTKSKTRDPGAVEQVEFYIGGAFRPAPKYQVKSFRAANTSQDLASRFRGLALHDISSPANINTFWNQWIQRRIPCRNTD